LILDLSEYGKFVLISAFRVPSGMVPFTALEEIRVTIPDNDIQFFDGGLIAGKEHLKITAINALHAFKTGINISKSLAMETLLYASAQRQIAAAISKAGVTQDSKIVGFLAFSESENDARELEKKIAHFVGAELIEGLLDEWSEEKESKLMALYEIGTVELEAIRMPGQEVKTAMEKAVVERVALLSTRT
jgi:tRNA threonylcarbamoyladenosine modification (KEOPS) complex Cgi121 subunit